GPVCGPALRVVVDPRGPVSVGFAYTALFRSGEGAVGGLHREHEARGGLKVEHARVGDRDLAGGAVDRKAAQGVAGGDRVGGRGDVGIGGGATHDVVHVPDAASACADLAHAHP